MAQLWSPDGGATRRRGAAQGGKILGVGHLGSRPLPRTQAQVMFIPVHGRHQGRTDKDWRLWEVTGGKEDHFPKGSHRAETKRRTSATNEYLNSLVSPLAQSRAGEGLVASSAMNRSFLPADHHSSPQDLFLLRTDVPGQRLFVQRCSQAIQLLIYKSAFVDLGSSPIFECVSLV